ncbi:MAG TPA: hypothetical protein VG476_15725, partial [Acidimicrobiales bacterium]|nr:hypothetical protein [Acidimicrobiales bacterium]
GAQAGKPPHPSRPPKASGAASGTFATGQLQDNTVGKTGSGSGCGTNVAGEPAIHVSPTNDVFLSSERGIGNGTDVWRGLGQPGGASATPCNLEYRGEPNASAGVGASGGDTDLAIAGATNTNGAYNVYVASLNLASVAVATSADNGSTFSNFPVQLGVPLDDRPWIAAYGAHSSLLSFHDIATGNIDILRTDSDGVRYIEISQAIPASDFKAGNNQHGNLVIDHHNTAGTVPNSAGKTPFWAFQSFVAPSSSSGSAQNEAYLAVSNDGGYTWMDRPVACSTSSAQKSLGHQFPNVSVDPSGNLWMAWSDDTNVYTAVSRDHGGTWACSGPVSTNTAQAVFPWLVATSAGVDLVYYGSTTAPGPRQSWSVYFGQNTAGTATGWGAPGAVVAVHHGTVCEAGATCSSGRQLFDDFGVDTDRSGLAHIAYSHDSPGLGGTSTYTGYAVQTGGTAVGAPN